MTDLPVEMLESAAQALIAFDGEHPAAAWEFYAEAALGAAGVPALLEERDRLREERNVLRETVRWCNDEIVALRGGSE